MTSTFASLHTHDQENGLWTRDYVTEDPINNKQQHLDVMCFPVLFPTGQFGKFHPCKEKFSHSEYNY